MALILLSLLVVAPWYLLTAVQSGGPLSTRGVLSSIGASGQIVLTLTFFGAVGHLRPAAVGVATVLVCGLLAAAGLRATAKQGGVLAILKRDAASIRDTTRAVLAWETVVLAVLVIFAGLWIMTAIAFYPPRGIDDVTYHLPLIYQSLQDHRLVMLPLELRGHFAYPLNGELLFLWVVLFTHAIRFVDAPQAVMWLVAFATVFALGRRLSLTARGAFLAAMLFAMMPVALLQAPSNYVDLISAAWLLSAVVALLHYEDTGSLLTLALAGVAVGLVAGTKASTLPLAALLIAFAAVMIWRSRRGSAARLMAAALFAMPALAACGYWYVRDWIVLGNPVFPYPIRMLGTTIFSGTLEIGANCWSAILADPREAIRIALWDPGIGSFHGGFGFVFWGFALPALVLQTARTFRRGADRRPGRFLVLSLWPFGLATLFLVGWSDLFVFSRLVLAIGAPAFIAFALLVDEARLRLPGAATALRILAICSAAAALVLMAPARWPLMNLAAVAADNPQQRAVSELKYLAVTTWDLRPLSGAWAPLDAMTRDGAGLTVYQAADWPVFWTAPTYGAELQNRIWNFGRSPGQAPDAFLFHSWKDDPFFVGPVIHRAAVAANPNVRLVASAAEDVTTLYVSTAALGEKGRAKKLADYYRLVTPGIVNATDESLASMAPCGVLLAPFPFAAGYIVQEADGRLRPELRAITTKDRDSTAADLPTRVVYTIGGAVPGRTASIIATISWSGSIVPVYRNEPTSALGRPCQ